MKESYVVRVELLEMPYPVWRTFEIQTVQTFWALHCAIQDSMGWLDCHLHEFDLAGGDVRTLLGIPDPDVDVDRQTLAGWEHRLEDWFPTIPAVCAYVYDFGDDWMHRVDVMERKEAPKGMRGPRMLAGEGRCPPEDVGGPGGFANFLDAMADPDHEEHEDYREWFSGPWIADFDPAAIRFSSPARRLQVAGLG